MEELNTILAPGIMIGSLICYILVVVKMFQAGDTLLGALSVLLVFCAIGGLLAFVMGWIKRFEYGTASIMPVWSILFATKIGLAVLSTQP